MAGLGWEVRNKGYCLSLHC